MLNTRVNFLAGTPTQYLKKVLETSFAVFKILFTISSLPGGFICSHSLAEFLSRKNLFIYLLTYNSLRYWENNQSKVAKFSTVFLIQPLQISYVRDKSSSLITNYDAKTL